MALARVLQRRGQSGWLGLRPPLRASAAVFCALQNRLRTHRVAMKPGVLRRRSQGSGSRVLGALCGPPASQRDFKEEVKFGYGAPLERLGRGHDPSLAIMFLHPLGAAASHKVLANEATPHVPARSGAFPE